MEPLIEKTTKTPPTNMNENKVSENNAKAMNVILCGLLALKLVKVVHCE